MLRKHFYFLQEMQIYLEQASLVGSEFLDSFLALGLSLPLTACFIEFGLQKSKKKSIITLSHLLFQNFLLWPIHHS